jgi:hypothetical protein
MAENDVARFQPTSGGIQGLNFRGISPWTYHQEIFMNNANDVHDDTTGNHGLPSYGSFRYAPR